MDATWECFELIIALRKIQTSLIFLNIDKIKSSADPPKNNNPNSCNASCSVSYFTWTLKPHFPHMMCAFWLPFPLLRFCRAPTFTRLYFLKQRSVWITLWHDGSAASCWKSLQRIVNTESRIIGAPLSSITDILSTHLTCKAFSIAKDTLSLTHSNPSLLPSGRSY